MTTKELKEQLQEDVTSFLGDFVDEQELTELCQIIVDRVNEFEISNQENKQQLK